MEIIIVNLEQLLKRTVVGRQRERKLVEIIIDSSRCTVRLHVGTSVIFRRKVEREGKEERVGKEA